MAKPLSFDEVNKLGDRQRSVPYKRYFGEMQLSMEQKEKRIMTAELFEEYFLYPFILMLAIYNYQTDLWDKAVEEIIQAYHQAIKESGYSDSDSYMDSYIEKFARTIVDTTIKHKDEPYYFSKDRIRFIAEGESSTFHNTEEYFTYTKRGYSSKTWNTIMDGRERDSHNHVNSRTIPIDSYFLVGSALMRYPHDVEMAFDHPEELVNCRCSVTYK